jgi:hypothetical protein
LSEFFTKGRPDVSFAELGKIQHGFRAISDYFLNEFSYDPAIPRSNPVFQGLENTSS